MTTTTQLPYLGKHVAKSSTAARAFTLARTAQFEREKDVADYAADPLLVLIAKVEHMAALLGCSEVEAERIILDRIGR